MPWRDEVTDPTPVSELEAALLERAEALAQEYIARGKTGAERIARDVNQRLRLREEREVLTAKAEAERAYRRRVQAAELRLQGELDRLRWQLVQQVMSSVEARAAAMVEDEPSYGSFLRSLLEEAANAIEEEELVVELSAKDQERLSGRWDAFVRDLCPGKRLKLSSDPLACSGGVRVRSADDRIRVDNTFEGRRDRLEAELYEGITEALFATAVPVTGAVNG